MWIRIKSILKWNEINDKINELITKKARDEFIKNTGKVISSRLSIVVGTFITGLMITGAVMTYDYITGLWSVQDALIEGYSFMDANGTCTKPVIYIEDGLIKIK